MTDDPSDDMQDACVSAGWNLEFAIVYAEDATSPGGAQISATCELAQSPDTTCPNLG